MSYIKDGIHRTDDETLVKSLKILAYDIHDDTGVAQECIREAALRLSELVEDIPKNKDGLYADDNLVFDGNSHWVGSISGKELDTSVKEQDK